MQDTEILSKSRYADIRIDFKSPWSINFDTIMFEF